MRARKNFDAHLEKTSINQPAEIAIRCETSMQPRRSTPATSHCPREPKPTLTEYRNFISGPTKSDLGLIIFEEALAGSADRSREQTVQPESVPPQRTQPIRIKLMAPIRCAAGV